jgi:hypothetical protein
MKTSNLSMSYNTGKRGEGFVFLTEDKVRPCEDTAAEMKHFITMERRLLTY